MQDFTAIKGHLSLTLKVLLFTLILQMALAPKVSTVLKEQDSQSLVKLALMLQLKALQNARIAWIHSIRRKQVRLSAIQAVTMDSTVLKALI